MTRRTRSTRRQPRHRRRRPARRARPGRRRGLAPATAAARSADLARSGRCSRHRRGAGAGSPGWPRRSGPPSWPRSRRLRRRLADVAAIERSDRRSVADRGRRLADPGTGLPGTSQSPGPAVSRLPVLQVNGALPDPSRVMVRSDATYRLVDLSTGTLGPASVGTYAGPQTMLPRRIRWLGLHLHGLDGIERRQRARGDQGTGRRRRHAGDARHAPDRPRRVRPVALHVRPAAAR